MMRVMENGKFGPSGTDNNVYFKHSSMYQHGKGNLKQLSGNQLSSMQRFIDNIRKFMVDNCDSHYIMRCSMSAPEDKVHILMIGSDISGNMKYDLEVIVDIDSPNVYLSRGLDIRNYNKLHDIVLDVLGNLTQNIPFTIGCLDFPCEGKFEEGYIAGYTREADTCIIYVCDSLKFDRKEDTEGVE